MLLSKTVKSTKHSVNMAFLRVLKIFCKTAFTNVLNYLKYMDILTYYTIANYVLYNKLHGKKLENEKRY